MDTNCAPLRRPSLTSWLALQGWFAASLVGRRFALFGALAVGVAVGAHAIWCARRTICSGEPGESEKILPSRICTQTELENFPQLDWADVGRRMTPAVRHSIETILETQDGSK